MATIVDVSANLGDLMLKGWVLLNDQCPKCNTPLMRSPKNVVPVTHICVKCETDPTLLLKPEASAVTPESELSPSKSTLSTLSSNGSDFASLSPPSSDQLRLRRQQSDTASSEIGKRMLKGWAMLAEHCPNPSCFGVPLLRPPMPGGAGKDPRKECVVCGTIYTTSANGTIEKSGLTPGLQAEDSDDDIPEPPPPRLEIEPVTRAQKTATPQPPEESSILQAVAESSRALQQTLLHLNSQLANTSGTSPNAVAEIAVATKSIAAALVEVTTLDRLLRRPSLEPSSSPSEIK